MFPRGSFGNPFSFNQPSSSRLPTNIEGSKPRIQDGMGIDASSSGYNSVSPRKSSSHFSSFSPGPSGYRGQDNESRDPYHHTNHDFSTLMEDHRSKVYSSGHNTLKNMAEAKKRARLSSDSSQPDAQHLDKSEKSKPKRKRPKFIRKVTCQVCGDVANDHIHYGAIACYSCRAFFRRGVKSNAPYFCSQKQSCSINKQSRKHCQYCRFQKCLSIGMKGSWVMTEEDKVEKKEKANIRRRWNQIKKFKKEPICGNEAFLEMEDINRDLPGSSKTMPPLQQIRTQDHTSYSSSYKHSVQKSDIALKKRSYFSTETLSKNPDSSILPSAAATAKAVVSAAENEHQLSQIPQLQRIQPYNSESTQFKRELDWEHRSTNYLTEHSSSVPGSVEERNFGLDSNTSMHDESSDAVKQEPLDMDISHDQQDPATPEFPMISTDMLREYNSDSSESGRDFSPGGEDYSPGPWRHGYGRLSYSTQLLKNRGKLEFSSNLINEPVMPFTREETALVTSVISTEKETTTSMPISNDTLQAIMNAVKTGTSLSYKATLEGYTVCMKRIIKFATKIDLFREFCPHDQKNLLLSNTDMLVNIRSARMLRPGYNLLDQLSVVYGKNKPLIDSSKTSVMPVKKRLEYKQVYSSPWASGEDEEQRFYSMMNTIFELQMDQTTTALIAMMALFSQVNK